MTHTGVIFRSIPEVTVLLWPLKLSFKNMNSPSFSSMFKQQQKQTACSHSTDSAPKWNDLRRSDLWQAMSKIAGESNFSVWREAQIVLCLIFFFCSKFRIHVFFMLSFMPVLSIVSLYFMSYDLITFSKRVKTFFSRFCLFKLMLGIQLHERHCWTLAEHFKLIYRQKKIYIFLSSGGNGQNEFRPCVWGVKGRFRRETAIICQMVRQ